MVGGILNTREYRMLQSEMLKNLYLHAASKADLQRNQEQQDREQFQASVQSKAQAAASSYQSDICYLEDFKKQANFNFLQSMALLAAHIAGTNKESIDTKMFQVDRAKLRQQKQKEARETKGPLLLGKSKRFPLDRYLAILDYLVTLNAPETAEAAHYGHSTDLLAVVNSLCEEGLLRKQTLKRADSALDDLCSCTLKCHFDANFIEEVAAKINFPLVEYLFVEGKEE